MVKAKPSRAEAMTDSIDYGKLMHNAMRGLIREVLSVVAEHGLPGEHHFFITFDTRHADVDIAPWLCERYPDEMTIVMQQWFDALQVGEDGFAVTLNFGDQPERLHVPYDAILTFVDPSVEFGLRFEAHAEAEASEGGEEEAPHLAGEEDGEADIHVAEPEDAPKKDADVVSLDKFRK